jgi:YHS domain-containing protein
MKSAAYLLLLAALVMGAAASPARAADYTHGVTGIGGYDPVAYFTDGKAVRGSGFHVSTHEGVTYLFASEEHRKQFESAPAKYLPAYGGYCAYGVAIGKKFYTDPEAWKVVDGKLYLNLDAEIQKKWQEDIPGFIKKADTNWPDLEDKAPF